MTKLRATLTSPALVLLFALTAPLLRSAYRETHLYIAVDEPGKNFCALTDESAFESAKWNQDRPPIAVVADRKGRRLTEVSVGSWTEDSATDDR